MSASNKFIIGGSPCCLQSLPSLSPVLLGLPVEGLSFARYPFVVLPAGALLAVHPAEQIGLGSQRDLESARLLEAGEVVGLRLPVLGGLVGRVGGEARGTACL